MTASSSTGPWIAVSGIDGAGKSTLLRWLAGTVLPGATVVKKVDRNDAERVDRFHHVWGGEDRILEDPPTAQVFGWATLFDYLAHAERVEREFATTSGTVLLDRWSHCVVAYCGEVLGLGPTVDAMVAPLHRPDLTLFLECRPAVARARITERSDAKPDESLRILEAFASAYTNVLDDPTLGPVARIAEGDPLSVCTTAVEALASHGLLPRNVPRTAPAGER